MSAATTPSRQEINLYLPHLRPRLDYLSAPVVAAGLMAMVAVLVLLSALSGWQAGNLAEQLHQQKQRLATLEQQTEDFKSRLPASDADRLEAQITSISDEIERRRSISELIDGQSIGNAKGFSMAMDSLASQVNDQVALTGFDFIAGGRRIALAGQALSPEAVPLYVERLQVSEGFKDSLFGQLQIQRVPGKSHLSFSLNQAAADQLRENLARASGQALQ
ncbi:hypothetical protein HBA55_32615 [Pseudomaricurvus alkylphenolicus]|jgi:MSHA biogenesis protein MshI|uniref:PilN domain-containing protein n=1 Tax=Pseudomaricurvus alkylphenolicus TaxID=1306991 RepID=UPI00142362D9|nr:PilN domain-containing protein [Pseudomaricurvus alkylphenolicus]NIB44383.1 hypothetical protein [Pseudomaricurvus alkylphenolicus]